MMLLKLCAVMFFIVAAMTSVAFATTAEEAPDCDSIETCLHILTTYKLPDEPGPDELPSGSINTRPIDKAIEKLQSIGDPAIGPLVQLLKHPKYHVRDRAAFTLSFFDKIDPIYLDDLIAARDSGTFWLTNSIGQTGTDKALEYLQEEFLKLPSRYRNYQVAAALGDFGNRNADFVVSLLAKCQASNDPALCDGTTALLSYLNPKPDEAFAILIDIAESDTAPEQVTRVALDALIDFRHPYGRDFLIQKLEKSLAILPPEKHGRLFWLPQSDSDRAFYDLDPFLTLRRLGSYGDAGRDAGETVRKFLPRKDFPKSRAMAAYVIGQIGYMRATGDLLRLESEFSDDWLLAYNTVESLGRLRARRAKPLLQRTAQKHWYKPVRNNAQRALNFFNGHPFALNTPANDGEPPEYYSDLRFSGDIGAGEKSCGVFEGYFGYTQYHPSPLQWPKDGVRGIYLDRLSEADLTAFAENYPSFNEDPAVIGRVRSGDFVIEFGGDIIAGTNFGEFGGGIYRIDPERTVELLLPGNAQAVFHLGEKLVITTGLAHMGFNGGNAWFVENRDGKNIVTKRIMLPASPIDYYATPSEILVIVTENGHAAIGADGKVYKPRAIGACNDEMDRF